MVMLCEVMLWLCYGYVAAAATAAVSARKEAVLWPPCQPGDHRFYTSPSSYLGCPSDSVVKNLPTMHELQELQVTRVRSLGGEDPLEEGMVTHSSIPAGKIPGQRKLMGYSP